MDHVKVRWHFGIAHLLRRRSLFVWSFLCRHCWCEKESVAQEKLVAQSWNNSQNFVSDECASGNVWSHSELSQCWWNKNRFQSPCKIDAAARFHCVFWRQTIFGRIVRHSVAESMFFSQCLQLSGELFANSCCPLYSIDQNSLFRDKTLQAMVDRRAERDFFVATIQFLLSTQSRMCRRKSVVGAFGKQKWFANDFEKTDQSNLLFVNKYRDDDVSNRSVTFLEYDWSSLHEDVLPEQSFAALHQSSTSKHNEKRKKKQSKWSQVQREKNQTMTTPIDADVVKDVNDTLI